MSVPMSKDASLPGAELLASGKDLFAKGDAGEAANVFEEVVQLRYVGVLSLRKL